MGILSGKSTGMCIVANRLELSHVTRSAKKNIAIQALVRDARPFRNMECAQDFTSENTTMPNLSYTPPITIVNSKLNEIIQKGKLRVTEGENP